MTDPVARLLDLVRDVGTAHERVRAGTAPDLGEDAIKVVFHPERFRSFLTGRDDQVRPITAELWPSLSCDAQCAMCTYTLNRARRRGHVDVDPILADTDRSIERLEDLAAAGLCSVIFTGGGEPTLHPELPALARCADALGLAWGLFTHGLHLDERTARALVASRPRFLRISVNTGSPAAHDREYRLGQHAYERVLQNIVATSRASAEHRRCVGVTYALLPTISDDELVGIRSFVQRAWDASDGSLHSVSFRPRVAYYDGRGQPRLEQPKAGRWSELGERLGRVVAEPLREATGGDLRIDLKRSMFDRIDRREQPAPVIGNGWATQLNHVGDAYILSELNGSPWPDTRLGNMDDGFLAMWRSEQRRAVAARFRTSASRAPVHHKLSHVDELLARVRRHCGVLTDGQVDRFYADVDLDRLPRPGNWDFL